MYRKRLGDHGFDVINILIGFDAAEAQMQVCGLQGICNHLILLFDIEVIPYKIYLYNSLCCLYFLRGCWKVYIHFLWVIIQVNKTESNH